MISLLSSPQESAAAYGCRGVARLALDGRRRRLLERGGTAATLSIVKRASGSMPVLLDALGALLNVSSDPSNQLWLAQHGLWVIVVHAFLPHSAESGMLAGGTLVNLAKNGANKPLMYRAEPVSYTHLRAHETLMNL
eukprot:1157835-Prymnesium_polylepis.1